MSQVPLMKSGKTWLVGGMLKIELTKTDGSFFESLLAKLSVLTATALTADGRRIEEDEEAIADTAEAVNSRRLVQESASLGAFVQHSDRQAN